MSTYSGRKPMWGGQKENQGRDSPAEKKRKLAGNVVSGVKIRTHRTAFSMVSNMRTVNTPSGKSSSLSSNGGGTPMKMNSNLASSCGVSDGVSIAAEDVETLLNMKMVGKTKFDFKVSDVNSISHVLNP